MRHPAQDEIDELCGEYFYILAPHLLPGCPPRGAGYSILSGPPPLADAGEVVGSVVGAAFGRYPVGVSGER
jgi:hypothetical protein